MTQLRSVFAILIIDAIRRRPLVRPRSFWPSLGFLTNISREIQNLNVPSESNVFRPLTCADDIFFYF